MAKQPATSHQSSATSGQPPAADKPPGYQPTRGRKLFMLALCILGLIIVWTYYFYQSGKP